jgi:hypothetical protein
MKVYVFTKDDRSLKGRCGPETIGAILEESPQRPTALTVWWLTHTSA